MVAYIAIKYAVVICQIVHIAGDSEEQVAVLQAAGAAMAAACVGADKERAALRQILESKVGS
jgi:hypothetical protein